MASVTPNVQRNKRILESWLRMIKSDTCNKTMLGSEFDVSPRTVGRILQSFGLTGREEDDREIVEELNDGQYDFKTNELEQAYFSIFLGEDQTEDDDEEEDDDWYGETDELDDEDFDDEFAEDDDLPTVAPVENAEDSQKEMEGEFETENVIDPDMTILDFSIARKYINIILETTETISIPDTDERFATLRELLLAGEEQQALELVSEKAKVVGWSNGEFRIRDNLLYVDNAPVHHAVAGLVIDAFRMNRPFSQFLKFYKKLKENSSYHTIQQLVPFLKHNDVEINGDGDIVAWKVVTEDYKDCHTGTFDNSVGTVVEMDRNEVDDNPSNTCSAGLHVCAKSYIKGFGAGRTRVVKVLINPADMVSVPHDYSGAKCRCCRYKVIADA